MAKYLSKIRAFRKNESGDASDLLVYVGAGALIVGVAAGCIAAGAYIGNGVGYLVGNLVNYLPWVNNAIPDMARSLGLSPNAWTNENVFQAAGTLSGAGFLGGHGTKYASKKFTD